MGVSRLLLWVAAGWAAVVLWRRWKQAGQGERTNARSASREVGRMVKCAECGVYLPEEEALRRPDANYQCRTHEPPVARG